MERTIKLAVLNVVTQPHSPDLYRDLLLRVKGLKKAAKIRGDRFGGIALMSVSKAGDGYVEGLLGTFTQIDVDGDWVNLATGKKAEGDELEGLFIPDDVRPNLVHFRFRFYLKTHVLIFETGTTGTRLPPRSAKMLFDRLFGQPKVLKDFGEVDVTVWPTHDSAAKIMANQYLRSVHIVISAPNPDTQAESELEYLERLEELKAKRLELIVVAKRNEFIEPDAPLVRQAKVAGTNGRVDAIVVREGRTAKVSTTDTPLIYSHTFDDRSNAEANEFRIAADALHHQLIRKGNG